MPPTLKVIGGLAPRACGACQRVVPAKHLVRRDRDFAELMEQLLDGFEPALGLATRGTGARRCTPRDRAQSPVHSGNPRLLLESSKPPSKTDRSRFPNRGREREELFSHAKDLCRRVPQSSRMPPGRGGRGRPRSVPRLLVRQHLLPDRGGIRAPGAAVLLARHAAWSVRTRSARA